jgi:hypothetical protein
MAGLAEIASRAAQGNSTTGRDVADIITFIEAPWGLGFELFPVQRVILKAYYGIPLDANPYKYDLTKPIPEDHPFYDADVLDPDGYYKYRIVLTDWRRKNPRVITEAEYLRMLYDDGRCNIREVSPGVERTQLILSIGRRSGKTTISACVAAYETYRLISKGDPQGYYGLPPTNNIQLISVATDKDQAGLLYQEVSGHFRNCAFFASYTANNTQSYARFQTPQDVNRYGSYREDQSAKATIKVTFRSCVAKGLRGPGNIVIILDEVAHFTDAGQSSADAVYKAVVPASAAYSPKSPKNKRVPIGPVESKIILISSPAGRQGLFYEEFQKGFRGGDLGDKYLCVQAPTWEVNPTIDSGFLETEYLKDNRTFDSEFGANFSDRTRGWLEKQEDLLACVRPELRPRSRATPRMPHFCGIDVGLVGDGTAIAIGHVEDNQIIVDVVDQIKAGEGDYANMDRLEFSGVADWIYDYSRRFFITEGIFDQWAGIPLEQALAERGLGQFQSVHHTQQITSQMYQNFKDMMFDKRLSLYDWPLSNNNGVIGHCPYIEQMLELQAEYKSKHVTLVAAPRVAGKHDDLADALVRMVWAASQNMGKRTALASVDRRPILHGAGTGPTTRDFIAARKKALQTGSHPDRQLPRANARQKMEPADMMGRPTFGRGRGGGRGGRGGFGFGRGR